MEKREKSISMRIVITNGWSPRMTELSLSRLCLEAIAAHIADCCKGEGNVRFQYSDAALSQLSHIAVKKILDIAVSKEMLSPEYCVQLIHKDTVNLDFTDLGLWLAQDIDQVLFKLHFCKKLVSVKLKSCRASSSSLKEFLCRQASLTYLNLSCSDCCDSVLENLAKSCPNLTKLNLESCRKITDSGIESFAKRGIVDAPLKITCLNLSSTSVTTKSLGILLNQLPLLTVLSFAKIKRGLDDSHDLFNYSFQKVTPFMLEYLDMYDTPLLISQMKIIFQHCANLVELKLNTALYKEGDSQTFSQSLLHLSKLKSLHIDNDISDQEDSEQHGEPLPFELLEPCLKQNGQELECLNLSNVKGIRLSTLCLYCNSLTRLDLSECQLVQPFLPHLEILEQEQKSSKASTGNVVKFSDFCPLQYFHLRNVEFKNISLKQKQELLYQLLTSHSDLLDLSLEMVPIEEDSLMKILQSSSGVQLQTLALSCYDNITAKTVRVIGETCPNLNSLPLFHCWIINWPDIVKINNGLRQNGRTVNVHTVERHF